MRFERKNLNVQIKRVIHMNEVSAILRQITFQWCVSNEIMSLSTVRKIRTVIEVTFLAYPKSSRPRTFLHLKKIHITQHTSTTIPRQNKKIK